MGYDWVEGCEVGDEGGAGREVEGEGGGMGAVGGEGRGMRGEWWRRLKSVRKRRGMGGREVGEREIGQESGGGRKDWCGARECEAEGGGGEGWERKGRGNGLMWENMRGERGEGVGREVVERGK